MMSTTRARLRRLVPAFVAIPLLAGLLVGANMAVASPVNANAVASDYKFQGMPIAMPPGYHPTQTIRPVNGAYQHLVSWISSVGASIAMTDVTGHGQAGGIPVHAVRAQSGAAALRLNDGADGLRTRRLQRRRPDGLPRLLLGPHPDRLPAAVEGDHSFGQCLQAGGATAGGRERAVQRAGLEHQRGNRRRLRGQRPSRS